MLSDFQSGSSKQNGLLITGVSVILSTPFFAVTRSGDKPVSSCQYVSYRT